MAAVSVIPSILDFFTDDIVRQEILPKTRKVYEQNGGDVKIGKIKKKRLKLLQKMA